MCGIAGIAGSTPLDEARLAPALAALAHRGPDGNGRFVSADGKVALLHTRLSIIDLSEAGHQPMALAARGLTITYNGEIYNYRELRAELERGGARFFGGSDTEVLLHGYAQWGEGVLARLNGIFAFAIHDARENNLFVARDHLGIKPLYLADGGGRVAFASEIKALAALGGAVGGIDPLAVARYATFLWCPGARTPYAGVRKLDPGGALIIRDGRILREWAWYAPPRYAPARFSSEAECAEAVAAEVAGAVRRQLVSDAPLGSFLSGGLDSSAVVAAARDVNPDLACYTIRVTGPQDAGAIDDLPYARRAAQALGVPLHEVEIASEAMAEDLARMVAMLDEPLADPASLNVYYICGMAREHGIKVLLSGSGGDDVFSGYRRHAMLALARRARGIPRPLLAAAAAALPGSGPTRRAKRLLALLATPPEARMIEAFRWTDAATLDALLTPEVRAAVAAEPVEQPLLDVLADHGGEPELEQCLALEKRFFLADHNLTYTDKMGMAASVEVRVPLLDVELLEFAATIPAEWKMRGATPKWIFKQSQRKALPAEIIDRPKAGFGAPLRQWMAGGFKPIVDDCLSPESLRRRGLFDFACVEALRSADAAGKVDAAYPLFALTCIEQWCRAFIDSSR